MNIQMACWLVEMVVPVILDTVAKCIHLEEMDHHSIWENKLRDHIYRLFVVTELSDEFKLN